MKHILLLKEENSSRDHLEQKLGSSEDVHVNSFGNSADTSLFLSFQPTLDLIFYSFDFDHGDMIEKFNSDIVEIITDQNGKLIGSNDIIKTFESAVYIHPQLPPDKVVHIVNKALEIRPDDCEESDFKCIPISTCIGMKAPPCDLYVRIGKGSNFVKRFNSKEEIDIEDLENFTKKSILKLYIAKDDIESLNNYFREKVKLQKDKEVANISKSDTSKQFFRNMKDSLDYVNFLFDDVGIKNKSNKVVTDVLVSLGKRLEQVSSNNKNGINEFLVSTLKSEDNFSAKHVALTSLLATNMLKNASWGSDTMISRVVYAAFFQDYTLKGNKKLITCLDEEVLYDMTADEQKILMSHAKDAIRELESAKVLPAEIKELILEQHGQKNGQGFPETKTSSSKLSALFRIASEFSIKLLQIYEKEATDDIQIQNLIKEEFERTGSKDKDIFELLSDSIII